MNIHPTITPASPSLASPIFDISFDSIESLTTTFASPVVPTLETTTVTEVSLGNHRNGQYSITAMTMSSGTVAERYAYTACGQPTIASASGTVLTSSAVGNRYTYTGREWDETLGLEHFRARWMSPFTGRFSGRDPIVYRDGPVLFCICSGLTSTDPEGMNVHSYIVTRNRFSPGARDEERFRATEFENLAKSISKIPKIVDLELYWNFQMDLEITRKNCSETCCGRDVPYRESEIELHWSILVGFSVPVHVLVQAEGEFQISAETKLSITQGECQCIRRRKRFGNLQMEGELEACREGKWGLATQACVGIKSNCSLFRKCGHSSSPQGKCSFSFLDQLA